jgi:hypothetical protein
VGRNALAVLQADATAGERTELDITYTAEPGLKPFHRPGLDDDPEALLAIRADLLCTGGWKTEDITFDAPELGLISLMVDADLALSLARHANVRSLGVMPALESFTAQSAVLSDFHHVWNAGFDGSGVTVAVIDDGFSPHPSVPAPVREACFCGGPDEKACCANNQTQVIGPGAGTYIGPNTGTGANEAYSVHGTSVLATLRQAATATTNWEQGLSTGISHVAINIGGKYGGYNGSGLRNALNWLRTATNNDVDVVNMSFGNFVSALPNATCNEMDFAFASTILSSLHDDGVTLVAAAGNYGYPATTWPACHSDVISVGSAWNQTGGYYNCAGTFEVDSNPPPGRMTCYTTRSTYMDLVAPGSAVTLARSQFNSGVWTHNRVERHGTSFAAPAAAACAAALLEANPSATPEELRTALSTSPASSTHVASGFSRPLLNCAHALAHSDAPKIPLANAGLSGAWYEPRTAGQGFYLNLYPSIGTFWGGWFTYDTTDTSSQGRRWYTLQNGTPFNASATTVNLAILRSTGGNFNVPPPTGSVQVGSAIASFTSCRAGTLAYYFNDGRNGTIPLTRLDTPFCNEAGTGLSGDISYTGLWHRDDLPGQGLFVRVMPAEQRLIGAWFTYDPGSGGGGAAGQEWYTIDNGMPGVGQPPGSQFNGTTNAAGINLIATAGGRFDIPNQTAPTSASITGSGHLQFTSCNTATLNYQFNDGRVGTIPLSRVGPAPGPC